MNSIETIANEKQLFNEKPDTSEKIFEQQSKEAQGKHRTRYNVALLGLAIAVVNCYAQATFCISIVEMVVPADYVIGGSSIQISIAGNKSTPSDAGQDKSCPIDHRYRDFYDSWRFPASPGQQQQASKQQLSAADLSNRFAWDASQQGLLLGAFAIGTAPLQIVGGRLAEIYGAKWVLLVACLGTALTNLSIPFLAHFSFKLLILNRVLMGIAQAGVEPGLMCLLTKWLTPAETGFYISMLLFAICIGFFLGSLLSSFLLALGYSWALTYYVAAAMNFILTIVWLLYASSNPEESKIISSEELDYILGEQMKKSIIIIEDKRKIAHEENTILSEPLRISSVNTNPVVILTQKSCHQQEEVKEQDFESCNSDASAPWFNIITTKSVWAFVICKFSIRWCADVLSIELPTYLANVLHLSIKANGILNSISSALFVIFSFLTGYLVNKFINYQEKLLISIKNDEVLLNDENSLSDLPNERKLTELKRKKRLLISKTNLRKFAQSIASFGSALAMFLMTHYDCNIYFSMSMLLVISCCLVLGTGGELQIPFDMTSKYPATLHGLACTISVSGWLAPPLIGLILGDEPNSRSRWNLVWYLTAMINLIGGIVFVLFADASARDFDKTISRSNFNQVLNKKKGKHEKSTISSINRFDSFVVGSKIEVRIGGEKDLTIGRTNARSGSPVLRKNITRLAQMETGLARKTGAHLSSFDSIDGDSNKGESHKIEPSGPELPGSLFSKLVPAMLIRKPKRQQQQQQMRNSAETVLSSLNSQRTCNSSSSSSTISMGANQDQEHDQSESRNQNERQNQNRPPPPIDDGRLNSRSKLNDNLSRILSATSADDSERPEKIVTHL